MNKIGCAVFGSIIFISSFSNAKSQHKINWEYSVNTPSFLRYHVDHDETSTKSIATPHDNPWTCRRVSAHYNEYGYVASGFTCQTGMGGWVNVYAWCDPMRNSSNSDRIVLRGSDDQYDVELIVRCETQL